MSHLPGQPHLTGIDFGASTQSAHEATVRGHSAPKLEAPLVARPVEFRSAADRHPRKKPVENGWGAIENSALLPDNDPMRRLRRRLMGLDPDED